MLNAPDATLAASSGASHEGFSRKVVTRRLMGTMATIHALWPEEKTIDEHELGASIEGCLDELTRFEKVFSTFRPDSSLHKRSRGEAVSSEDACLLEEVERECRLAAEATDGLFDAWWKGYFDPTGYVKGWAVQRAAERELKPLIEGGRVEAVGINMGGDMQLFTAPGSAWLWHVGIADPQHPGELIAVLSLANGAVASSGTAERGQHIIDPRTGRAASSVASATVVARDLSQADMWATTAVVAGMDDLTWLGRAHTTSGLLRGADGSTRRWSGEVELCEISQAQDDMAAIALSARR